MIKNIAKNLEFFKNTKKIEGIKKLTSLKSNHTNTEESPIKLFSSNSKLTLYSLFIEKNNNYTYNISVIISIISFLSYTDLLQFQKISKKFYRILSNKKIRKEYILHTNMASNEHLLFYESNIKINQLKNNLIKELIDFNITSNIYKNILSLCNGYKGKNVAFTNVLEEIKRDIDRTFYTDKFKKGNGKTINKCIINFGIY